MAAEKTSKLSEAYPMKAGDGPNSYAKNSAYQKGVVGAAKELLNRAIAEKLDVEIFLSSNTFHIADLGCSVGPNTFLSVENILEAVEFKYQGQGFNSQIPEFQYKGTLLFTQSRRYYAAGVPGSFYCRIFANASIHLVHSSYALHWHSRVPKEVVDIDSPAWNKGRIHYSNSTEEVVRAYEVQYAEDMECFLHARAQEIVYGGLMVLIIPGRPNGTPHSRTSLNVVYQLLGSCLMDLARKGVVRDEKVDSFNIPIYNTSPRELQAAVEKNGCFSTEKMENLPHISAFDIENVTRRAQLIAYHVRAATEGLIKQQFGDEILDELFGLYSKKLEQQPSIFESVKAINFLVVLKCKAT
ncbi:hypothetical protein ACE6H2_018535 [Prunus campanulata]